MYVLLKNGEGQMIVRRIEYWEKFINVGGYIKWTLVTQHPSSSALLKMIEIATDSLPDDEKKRQERANNAPEHVEKLDIIH